MGGLNLFANAFLHKEKSPLAVDATPVELA